MPEVASLGEKVVPREASGPLASHQSNQSIIINVKSTLTNRREIRDDMLAFLSYVLTSAVMEGGDLVKKLFH